MSRNPERRPRAGRARAAAVGPARKVHTDAVPAGAAAAARQVVPAGPAAARKAHGVDPALQREALARLRRIEGQVRGVQRMVAGGRYCADILTQVSSVQEALRAVGKLLMRNHLEHCVTDALRSGDRLEAERSYEEVLELMYTHAR
jgi:DNA-binding FrmR family transcriptional regulator